MKLTPKLPRLENEAVVKFYAVIDTNVLVSAMLKWDSIPGRIISLAFLNAIVPLVNEEILNEYRSVLLRPKFHFSEKLVNEILHEIVSRSLSISEEYLNIDFPDPKDRVFYEVCMEARKDDEAYLITGNIKHFPRTTFVVTPHQMLDIIINDSDFSLLEIASDHFFLNEPSVEYSLCL